MEINLLEDVSPPLTKTERKAAVFVQEQIDGCVECMADETGTCRLHTSMCLDMVINPEFYAKLVKGGKQ